MRTKTEPNGFMTLKIELMGTDIKRTIVVPEHMTLEDLHDAIQSVMGWEDAHLWHFTDRMRDGVIYELPHDDDGFPSFAKRLTLDASQVALRKVLPERGAKLFYEYDFGDSWDHVITRQSDPKTPEIACVKAQGPDGIEDIGGRWRLADFIEAMRNDPDSEECAELREWAGLDTQEDLNRYLEGDSLEKRTADLRATLSHLKPVEKLGAQPKKPMTEDEKANTLGMIFATLVNAELWKILEKAMSSGGTCEFDDPYKDIGEFFLTMFDGLKIKDGRGSIFFMDPSKLTVPKEWVEMYKTHGEEWRQLHEQFDIIENYASSSVRLYGVVSGEELYDIVKRYDPGVTLSVDEMLRHLEARSIHCPRMLFRVQGGLVVSEDSFPTDIEDIDTKIEEFRKVQSEDPRWYPSTRNELFAWADVDSFECTPESDKVEKLLKRICDDDGKYESAEALFATYNLLTQSLPPETLCDYLVERDILPKLSDKQKRELVDAIDAWSEIVHMPAFNGNTIKDLRVAVAQPPNFPKVGRNEPCPCGSGKKFKHCCGSGRQNLGFDTHRVSN